MPEAAISRAGDKIKLTLAFIKVDKTVQKAEIDITEVVTNSESGGSGGGNVDEPPTGNRSCHLMKRLRLRSRLLIRMAEVVVLVEMLVMGR